MLGTPACCSPSAAAGPRPALLQLQQRAFNEVLQTRLCRAGGRGGDPVTHILGSPRAAPSSPQPPRAALAGDSCEAPGRDRAGTGQQGQGRSAGIAEVTPSVSTGWSIPRARGRSFFGDSCPTGRGCCALAAEGCLKAEVALVTNPGLGCSGLVWVWFGLKPQHSSTLSFCLFQTDSIHKPDLLKSRLLSLVFALITYSAVTPRCFAPNPRVLQL